jgi:hypothetical protein
MIAVLFANLQLMITLLSDYAWLVLYLCPSQVQELILMCYLKVIGARSLKGEG